MVSVSTGISSLISILIFSSFFRMLEINDIRYHCSYFERSGVVDFANKGDYDSYYIYISYNFLGEYRRICEISYRDIPLKKIRFKKLSSILSEAGGYKIFANILTEENLPGSRLKNSKDYKFVISRLEKFFTTEMEEPLLEYESIVNNVFRFLLIKKLQNLLGDNLSTPPREEILSAVDCILEQTDQQMENPFTNNPSLFSLFPEVMHKNINSEIVNLCHKLNRLVKDLEREILNLWQKETSTIVTSSQEGTELIFFPLFQIKSIDIHDRLKQKASEPFYIYFKLRQNEFKTLKYEFSGPCVFHFEVRSADPDIKLREVSQKGFYAKKTLPLRLRLFVKEYPFLYLLLSFSLLLIIISCRVSKRFKILPEYKIISKLGTSLGSHEKLQKEFYKRFRTRIVCYLEKNRIALRIPIDPSRTEEDVLACSQFVLFKIFSDKPLLSGNNEVNPYLEALVLYYIKSEM